MQKRELVRIRPGLVSDEPLIYSTWLKGLRYSNDWFRQINQDAYFSNYHRVIEAILSRPTIHISVACLQDDEDVVLGYSVTEPSILHWVFVKPAWRGIKIVEDLVPRETMYVTHLTRVGLKLKPDHVIFNPFL